MTYVYCGDLGGDIGTCLVFQFIFMSGVKRTADCSRKSIISGLAYRADNMSTVSP